MQGSRSFARPLLWLALPVALLVLAPVAVAKCPDNPKDCQRMRSVWYDVVPDFGSGSIEPDLPGNLLFRFYEPPEAVASSDLNLTIEVLPTSSQLVWSTGLKRTIVLEPDANAPHIEAFAFRVDSAAAPGLVEISYVVSYANETSSGSVQFEVDAHSSLPGGPFASLGGIFPEALWGLLPGMLVGGLLVAARVGFRNALRGRPPSGGEAPKRPDQP